MKLTSPVLLCCAVLGEQVLGRAVSRDSVSSDLQGGSVTSEDFHQQ